MAATATATTASGAPLALPAPPEPVRPRLLIIGTAFAAAAMLAAFAGLLGLYLHFRAGAVAAGQDWVPSGSIPLTQGNVATVTLFMACVTAQWAFDAIKRNDRPQSYVALGVTLLLGAAFINSIAYYISQSGIGVGDSEFSLLLYAIMGGQIVIVGIALIFTALMAFRALGGQFNTRNADGLAASALWWWACFAISAVIWYAVYITK